MISIKPAHGPDQPLATFETRWSPRRAHALDMPSGYPPALRERAVAQVARSAIITADGDAAG
jgi:hypothetical protein